MKAQLLVDIPTEAFGEWVTRTQDTAKREAGERIIAKLKQHPLVLYAENDLQRAYAGGIEAAIGYIRKECGLND